MQYAPYTLKLLVQWEFENCAASWLKQVCSDILFVRSAYLGMMPMHSPFLDPTIWSKFFLSDDVIFFCNAIDSLLAWTPSVVPEQVSTCNYYSCLHCGESVDSQCQLDGHMWAKHKHRNPIHFKIAGNTCPSCLVCFQYRIDIIRHLRRSEKCRERILTLPDICPELAQELSAELAMQDKMVRRAGMSALGHRVPAMRACGPLRWHD